MAYEANYITAPNVNPELSAIENMSIMTPAEVRWLQVAGLLDVNQFTDEQIHPEVLAALEPGDEMYFLVPHPERHDMEKLSVTISRNTADTITSRDLAIDGLQRLGLLRAGSVWEDYRAHDVVTIYSELHGAVRFGFDTKTGRRFMPESVEGIHPGRGWSIINASGRLSLELSFATPSLTARASTGPEQQIPVSPDKTDAVTQAIRRITDTMRPPTD